MSISAAATAACSESSTSTSAAAAAASSAAFSDVQRRLDLTAPLTAALVLSASFALHVHGMLAPLERIVTEARTRALAHQIESDIVVVEIDSKSLADLDEWPWPRRHFARLLQQLDRAEP